jgi:hypothetical protein
MTARTEYQQRIDRALTRVLLNLGDYLLPEKSLAAEIELGTHPRPAAAEIAEAIRHADSHRRIISVRADTGLKWKLTELGRAWAAENL